MIYGTHKDDDLYGTKQDDILNGGPGMDTLYGRRGDDVLISTGGFVDTMFGGAGDDRFRSQAKFTNAMGGTGDDVFVFNIGSHTTTRIGDFGRGDDVIVVKNFFWADEDTAFDLLKSMMSESAGGVAVIDGNGQSLLHLQGVEIADLRESDFRFHF